MEVMAPLRPARWFRWLFPHSHWDNHPHEQILLSFDDGPGPQTERLLDRLLDRQAGCWFFLLPENAVRFPRLVQRMQTEGHVVGSHFLRHAHYWHLRKRRFQEELTRSCRVLEDILGERIRYCRAPYGRLAPRQESWITDLGLTHVFWSLDSRDYLQEPFPRIQSRLRQHLHPGDLVLMHDGATAHPDLLRLVDFVSQEWNVQNPVEQ